MLRVSDDDDERGPQWEWRRYTIVFAASVRARHKRPGQWAMNLLRASRSRAVRMRERAVEKALRALMWRDGLEDGVWAGVGDGGCCGGGGAVEEEDVCG